METPASSYALLLDALSGCRTSVQVAACLRFYRQLPDRQLLQQLAERQISDEQAVQQQWLRNLILEMLIDQMLGDYLRISDVVEAYTYVVENPELLTHEAYTALLARLAEAAGDYQARLVTCQERLAQTAAAQLLLNPAWSGARPLLLGGQRWLSHAAVAPYLQRVAVEHPDLTERATLLADMLASCSANGFAEYVRQKDLDLLLEQLDAADGEPRLALLRQIVPLVPASSAELLATLLNEIGLAYQYRLADEKAANLEAAISYFEQALRTYPQPADNWAITQSNLGVVYRQRVYGVHKANVETAIACCQEALTVFTYEHHREDWAITHNTLGNAYSNRLAGLRAANLEAAIACFRRTLLVYTFEVNPDRWADVQHNLGNTYLHRLKGEPAANLEEAIACCERALQRRTRAQHARKWAETQNSLGVCYRNRLAGSRKANVEHAIACFKQTLDVYAPNRYAEDWALAQHNLGNAYATRLAGSRKANIETAITCYEQALSVRTRTRHAADWAATQNSLGNAYWDRRTGERKANVEAAIACYQLALTVRTRAHHAADWAMTQHNLGAAYRSRLAGRRRSNLERAIACYQRALRVRTHAHHAKEWADTQYNLGTAYLDRLAGERKANVEAAIACYEQALRVCTRQQYAEDWAATQNGLGSAYRERLSGERAANLEEAIACFERALTVITRRSNAKSWADTQNNLGAAYQERGRAEPTANTEAAISCFKRALQVYTYEQYGEEWAATQHNLGVAYQRWRRAGRTLGVEEAISCYEQALRVYTRQRYAEKWSQILYSLGNAYQDRSAGERSANIEQAIGCYKQALRVRTRTAYAEDWAMTQNSLGNAYRVRPIGKRPANVAAAIACFQRALEVSTREQFTADNRRVWYNLGGLLYEEKRWAEARHAYGQAHEALTLLRGETLHQESRRRLAQEHVQLGANLVHCCLVLDDPEAAADYALASKSRSLAELLAGSSPALQELLAQDASLAAAWEPAQHLQRALDAVLDSRSQLAAMGPDEYRPATATEQKFLSVLRQELNQLTDDLLFRFPALATVQELPPLSARGAQSLSAALGAVPLVEYVQHGGGWGAFVCTPDAATYVSLADNLSAQLAGYLQALLQNKFWIIDRLAQDQAAALAHLYELLVQPLRDLLPTSGALVLAPTGPLHLIPFQALRDTDGQYFGLTYALSFVPSLATLRVLHEQARQVPPPVPDAPGAALLSVAYAGAAGPDYLSHVQPEAEAVQNHFAHCVPLHQEQALPAYLYEQAIRQPFAVVHINCHAHFSFNQPLNSALRLAQGRELTVNDIRLNLRLRGRPLVVLSACQTGLTRPEQADEATGLAWAFLAAGASGVVASQWPVSDEAARALFEAFYRLRLTVPNPAEALRQAMQQLRRPIGWRNYPGFWAAFQVIGLPGAS